MSSYTVPCRDFLALYTIIMITSTARDTPIAMDVTFSLPLSVSNQH